MNIFGSVNCFIADVVNWEMSKKNRGNSTRFSIKCLIE